MRVTFNLLGPQGSGKGTQADVLVERFDFARYDLGENLRQIEESGSELGQQLSEYVDHGKRVPPHLIAEVTRAMLSTAPKDKDILFDGLLRAMDELEVQRDTFTSFDLSLPVIIFLNLDEETAIARLSTRRICSVCHTRYRKLPDQELPESCSRCGGQLITRHDDTAEAIAQRLAWYHRDTEPVIEYFKLHGKVIEVDASPSIEEVTANIVAEIEAHYASLGLKPPVR